MPLLSNKIKMPVRTRSQYKAEMKEMYKIRREKKTNPKRKMSDIDRIQREAEMEAQNKTVPVQKMSVRTRSQCKAEMEAENNTKAEMVTENNSKVENPTVPTQKMSVRTRSQREAEKTARRGPIVKAFMDKITNMLIEHTSLRTKEEQVRSLTSIFEILLEELPGCIKINGKLYFAKFIEIVYNKSIELVNQFHEHNCSDSHLSKEDQSRFLKIVEEVKNMTQSLSNNSHLNELDELKSYL